MIDLTKSLPNTLTVGGRQYAIYTDFRVWLRLTQDLQHLKEGQILNTRYLFKNDYPQRVTIEELRAFLVPKNELPRKIDTTDAIAIDYFIDGDLIFASILAQYGVDLIEVEELHWHKFLAMLNGLNEGQKLREVMSYRMYKPNHDKNSNPYEKLRLAWEIVREEDEDKEAIDSFSKKFEVTKGQTDI